MKAVAFIPARAGSKGIPGKNRRLLGGVSLVERAVNVARSAGLLAVVSTDDTEIGMEAWSLRCSVLARPAHLAQDDTPMRAVVLEALPALRKLVPGLEAVVLLQPTQPLRTPEHVRAALRLLDETREATSVVSVVEVPQNYSPDRLVRIWDERLATWRGGTSDLGDPHYDTGRRQDARPAYSRDGTVYAIRCRTIEGGSLYGDHCVPLIIPAAESVNLDTEDDWAMAERALEGRA